MPMFEWFQLKTQRHYLSVYNMQASEACEADVRGMNKISGLEIPIQPIRLKHLEQICDKFSPSLNYEIKRQVVATLSLILL